MNEICIYVPSLEDHQTVEVAVTVNGKKKLMNYRVESFDWSGEGGSQVHRIERLRNMIESYDSDWELVQIGVADGHMVPVMFRQRILEGD